MTSNNKAALVTILILLFILAVVYAATKSTIDGSDVEDSEIGKVAFCLWSDDYEGYPAKIYYHTADGNNIEYIPKPEETSRHVTDSEIAEAKKIIEEAGKTYTAEELDEIYKDEPELGRLAKDLWGVGEGNIIWKKDLPKFTIQQVLDSIPTWPEYVELEKTIIMEYEYENGFMEVEKVNDDGSVNTKPSLTTVQYSFPKGTKIYYEQE